MALTQAQKSSAFRKRRDAKIKRYEEALREIADMYVGQPSVIAKAALSERGEAGR